MQQRAIQQVHVAMGERPGFLFETTSQRLFVVGPMNPEWSETVKLPNGMRIEVFAGTSELDDQSPIAVLAAGAPSAVTFRKRVPPGVGSVQYLVTLSDESSGRRAFLLPAEIVEIDSGRGWFANITFSQGDRRINIHFDTLQ